MSPMNTNPQPRLDAVLRQASQRIELTDARPLLAHALDKPVSWLFAHGDEPIEISALQRFHALLEGRESGRPVAYLIGRCGFWTLDLTVTADTLIPRPETELLVELAVARLPVSSPSRVADLGTGSGAIALAIAKERPECRVIATDASKGALDIAIGNAEGNGVRNVEFRMGNWFSPLTGERFELIASNPPYIAEGDPHLEQGDLRFEPAAALSSGADGLDAIREIVSGAGAHLAAGGWLLLEHGLEQGAAIRELLDAAGFVDVTTERDLESRDRVTLGRRPG
jgi:release factor glutamine methyltransferase